MRDSVSKSSDSTLNRHRSQQSSTLPPLTVIVLANEFNSNLQNCLQSVEFALQILVVNTGPDDMSSLQNEQIKIINHLPAGSNHSTCASRIVKISNFAKLRNWAMKHAKYDWILFLDSDEFLANPKQAVDIINQTMSNHSVKSKESLETSSCTSSKFAGFKLRRQDIFLCKKLKYGESVQWLPRLINKTETEFVRPVHETVVTKNNHQNKNRFNSEYETVRPIFPRLNILILHRAHDSISRFLQKISDYAQIEAQYQAQLGENRVVTWLKLVCFPPAKFIYNYLLKLGILDGYRGLIYASIMSLHSLLVRVYMIQNRLLDQSAKTSTHN